MNKNTIFFPITMLILVFGSFGYAQIAYFDAIYLRDSLTTFMSKDEKAKRCISIMRNYLPVEIRNKKSEDIYNYLTQSESPGYNPFMYDIFRLNGSPAGGTFTLPNSNDVKSIIPTNISNLDVTSYADAMAKFLVKRTKQELAIAFFDDFRKALTNNDNKDLQVLFPATTGALIAIGDEIYRFNAYMQTLRECFEKDLNELPEHLPDMFENHKELFRDNPELETLLKSVSYFAGEIRCGAHPGEMLDKFPFRHLDGVENWKGALQTLRLISESLRDTAGSVDYWVSADQISNLVNDTLAFRIYLGLVYQSAKKENISFKDKKLYTLLDPGTDSTLKDYQNKKRRYLYDFMEKTVNLSSVIYRMSKSSNDTAKLELYSRYIGATMDLLETAFRIGGLVDTTGNAFLTSTIDSLGVLLKVVDNSLRTVENITTRNYASVIINIAEIYKLTIGSKQPNDDFLKEFIKYGTFAATIIQANNSDEIEAAIEAMVLPAGSSRIKRASRFNVSLNAYVGLFGGWEKIKGYNQKLWPIDKNNLTFGLSAPIGLALSVGTPNQFSHSFFISLVDLGAIASFRFQDDSTEQIPATTLGDIFSAGAFYSLGLPKLPLSINIGGQMSPNVHKVKADGKESLNALAYRVAGAVCVDIPLLNFYTKPN